MFYILRIIKHKERRKMKVKSIFLDTIPKQEREPLPKFVPKAEKKGGKLVWGKRERKCTL